MLRDAKRALDTVEDEVGSLRMSCDAMNARIQGNPKIAFRQKDTVWLWLQVACLMGKCRLCALVCAAHIFGRASVLTEWHAGCVESTSARSLLLDTC